MRGFIVGTLALVALEVLTRKGSADRLSTGIAWADTALNRLLSPTVAAIPNRHAGSITVVVSK